MFAVEHPLDLPLAERDQERTYGRVYSWNNTKRIKEFTTGSQRYRENSVKGTPQSRRVREVREEKKAVTYHFPNIIM